MQNRYVGDIGDYGKFALLRALSAIKGDSLRLGIVWCLFPDEGHNSDGKYISYLNKGHLRDLDTSLHDQLKHLVVHQNRTVAAIAESELFRSDTIFFDAPTLVPDVKGLPSPDERVQYRSRWLEQCLEMTSGCNFVFFDPDNGLETPSVDKRNLKAGKYIFWDELTPFVDRGQSLVVYHHLNRTASVAEQVNALGRLFKEKFTDADKILPLIYRRGSCRVFWVVANGSLASELDAIISGFLDTGWRGHFEIPCGFTVGSSNVIGKV